MLLVSRFGSVPRMSANPPHSSQLSHLSDSLNQIIRIDPFSLLPREVSLRILGYLDAISLGRAAQVSKTWKALADDDLLWRRMCGQHIERKCEKCGWGLPLLERRRLKVELKDRSPIVAHGVGGHHDHAHDYGVKEVMTRSEVLGPERASTSSQALVSCDLATPAPNSTLKRPAPTEGSTWAREKKPKLEGGSDSEGESAADAKAGILSRDVRLTRPWKSVYCERLIVERNWRKGRCQTKTLKGHTDGIMCLQYHTALTDPNYPVLITGSYDRTVRIWNLDTGEQVNCLRGHTRAVRALQFDQMLLFTGSMDGTVRMWNWRKGQCLRVLEGHRDGVVSLHYNGYLLASGSADSTIIVRNLRNGTKFTLAGHNEWVNSVVIWDGKSSPGDLDPTAMPTFTQALSRNRLQASPGPDNTAFDIDAGTMLFSGSDDGTVKLWDLVTQQCLRTFTGHKGQIQSLRILMTDQSPEDEDDHEPSATEGGSAFGQASAVGLNTSPYHSRMALPPTGDEHVVPHVYVHSEEDNHHRKAKEASVDRAEVKRPLLVTGSLDGTVKVWDVETGREKSTLFGHIEGVWAVDIDALRLASASHDRTIKVWDREAGNCVQTLVGHRGAVTSLQLSDDMIVSGSDDGDVIVWSFGPGAEKKANSTADNSACIQAIPS